MLSEFVKSLIQEKGRKVFCGAKTFKITQFFKLNA